MPILDIVFFLTTAILLADAIFSLIYIKNSLWNYNLEIQARYENDYEKKQKIVNEYIKDYGVFRSLIKFLGSLSWTISGLFTQIFYIVIGLFILKIIYRLMNRKNVINEGTYCFRVVFYIGIYIYILHYYSGMM